MNLYNIPRRTPGEGLRISLNTPEVKQKMRAPHIRQGFSGKRIGHIADRIRNCVRPLRKSVLLNSLCQECHTATAQQTHHSPPLGNLVVELLANGLSDLAVIKQLTADHYAGKIPLIPLCVECHKRLHAKQA
jgi:hypothetical protein